MGALDVIDDFSLKLGMNAEVDTMGGSVENVVNVIKVSSRDEVFENVQEELKEQLLYRDLAQRELEFLESGGDPLDFRFRHTPSVSVQSTSLTGQLQEQIVTSKAKSDISLIGTMAHSDEPTLQQRKLVSDANDVEIISSFDGNNLLADAENNSIQLHNISSLEQSSRVEGTQDAKESEESTIFRPYTRRIRSKPTHNLSSSESTDVLPSRGSVHAPVPSRFGLRETDGSVLDSNHIDQNNSSCLVKKSTRPNPDETHTVVDASKPNPKCSSSVEAWAGLPKNSSDEGSLPALTSVVPKVHFDDANRTLDDESTKVIVGKSLLGNGCMHSEDYNENDDVVVETESRCVQENSQGEVEKGMSKYANECDTGQIAFVDDKADHQNNFEKNSNVRTPEMSEMVNEFQEGARISTVSSGTESNYPAMSGIFSVHAYERSNRVFNYTLDPCAPVHITIGDGGNREKMAVSHADEPGNCPEPSTTPDTYMGGFCAENFTSGPAKGKFCWDRQPDYSAFRESSFGHGILEVKNETWALWSWNRNQDPNSTVADQIYIVRQPELCSVRQKVTRPWSAS